MRMIIIRIQPVSRRVGQGVSKYQEKIMEFEVIEVHEALQLGRKNLVAKCSGEDSPMLIVRELTIQQVAELIKLLQNAEIT